MRFNSASSNALPERMPRINYRPAFDQIMGYSNRNLEEVLTFTGAPQRLIQEMNSLLSVSKSKGVLDQSLDLLRFYSSDVKNDITLLTIKRLSKLIETTEKEKLPGLLQDCKTLMKENHEIADTIPEILNDMHSKFGSSYSEIGLININNIIRRSSKNSKSTCPVEITLTMNSMIKNGNFSDIPALTKFTEIMPLTNNDQKTQQELPQAILPNSKDSIQFKDIYTQDPKLVFERSEQKTEINVSITELKIDTVTYETASIDSKKQKENEFDKSKEIKIPNDKDEKLNPKKFLLLKTINKFEQQNIKLNEIGLGKSRQTKPKINNDRAIISNELTIKKLRKYTSQIIIFPKEDESKLKAKAAILDILNKIPTTKVHNKFQEKNPKKTTLVAILPIEKSKVKKTLKLQNVSKASDKISYQKEKKISKKKEKKPNIPNKLKLQAETKKSEKKIKSKVKKTRNLKDLKADKKEVKQAIKPTKKEEKSKNKKPSITTKKLIHSNITKKLIKTNNTKKKPTKIVEKILGLFKKKKSAKKRRSIRS